MPASVTDPTKSHRIKNASRRKRLHHAAELQQAKKFRPVTRPDPYWVKIADSITQNPENLGRTLSQRIKISFFVRGLYPRWTFVLNDIDSTKTCK